MLGLPDEVHACLFDLDGVLTDTASVHRRRGRRCSTTSCAQRAEQTGETFVPVRRRTPTTSSTSTARHARTASGRSWPAAASSCPTATPTTIGRQRHRLRPRQPQERRLPGHVVHEDGVKVFDGSRRYLEAVAAGGLAIAVVSSCANTREVLEVTGLDSSSSSASTASRCARSTSQANPRRTRILRGARRLGVDARRGGGIRGRPFRGGGRPRRALRPRRRRRPGRAGRRAATPRRRRRRDRPRRPAWTPDDHRMTRSPSSRGRSARPRSTSTCLAQSESLFALSNGHIGLARQPRRRRAARPAGHLPQLVLRDPAAALRRGRLRLSRRKVRPIVDVTNGKILRLLVDDEPFDVRYGELLHHERVLDLRAGTLTRTVRWRPPPASRSTVTSTRLVSLAQRGVAAIEYIVEAVDEFTRVTVQSELVANEDQPETSNDPRVSAHPRPNL